MCERLGMGGPFGGSRHAPLGGSPFRGVLPVSLPKPLAIKNQAVADNVSFAHPRAPPWSSLRTRPEPSETSLRSASGIEGEYRSIAEICLSRKARSDAQKKKEAIAPFFAFEACAHIWLLPTEPDRLRVDVDSLFVLA